MILFLLFGQLEGYATGGAHDLLKMSSSLCELELFAENDLKNLANWWHIYCTNKQKIVKESPRELLRFNSN